MRIFLLSIILGIVFMPTSAFSMVVGSDGNTFEIAEKDMRELIQEKAQKFDFESWKYEQMSRISEKISKFRPAEAVSGLPVSLTGEAYRVDLTYTLPYNIHDISGNILYPQGYSFNPLALMQKKGLSFTKIVVILNGTRECEITWFKNKFEDYKANHIILLITDGYAIELAEKLGRPVMYLSELLRAKLQVKETPSVVVQANRSTFLTVKPYVLDHTGKELSSAKQKRRK